jgi:hypothetical protein
MILDFSQMLSMRHAVVILFLLVCPALSFAAPRDKTKEKKEEKLLEDGEFYFGEKSYLRALPYYKSLVELDSLNPFYHYRLGICYLYKNDEREQSLIELKKAQMMDDKLERIDFYVGRAYHLNYRFDEAIRSFEYALNDAGNDDKEIQEIRQYISYCESAKKIIKDPAEVEIKNVGSDVNSPAGEYVPVITIDESTLIFTYRGERSTGGLQDLKFRPDTSGDFYEDIMMSQRVGERWLSPELIPGLNTNMHDASIALSNDGQILFIFKSTTKDGGDIFESTLNGSEWSTPVRLGPNINSKYWEGSCSLSGDGQLLYFASDRPGGLGGRDIYVSRRQSDGSWGPAQNLGPSINTRYNDDAPSIHPDGIHLFFSSEGHSSMGGFDLFYSNQKAGVWQEPINLGFPINTPADERYYVLSADGGTAYYSSDNKGGFGQQDIYTVTPGFQGEPPILALVVGFVTLNGQPVDSKISVSDSLTGNTYGEYHSNAASGKYLIALKPGNVYKVAIEVEGQESMYEYVNVKDIDTYVQVSKDYNFVGDSTATDPAARIRPVVADSNDVLQKKLDAQLQRIREEQNDQVYEQRMYQQMLKKHGQDYDTSTTYMVELGTFENPKDFDSTKFAGMGPIVSTKTPEGHMRYSVGPFKTLLDAELYRTRLNTRDSLIATTSEVVVIKNGERKTIPSTYRTEYRRKGYVPREETQLIKSRKGTLITTVPEGNGVGYDKIVEDKGTFQADGLTYKLELGAVTDSTKFDRKYWEQYGKVEKKLYPDGTIRYTMGPWNTLKEAEDFKRYLMSRDSAAAKSIVTVFYFGQRKTVEEFFNEPCNNNPVDLAWFKGKSLNDTAVYNRFLKLTGNYCNEGLTYTVQIGAYRHPENFKYPQLAEYGAAKVIAYPDGITRFTLKEFKTIKEAEVFRQQCIRKGITDAWIKAWYKGECKTLEDLIQTNFFGKAID